MKKLLFALCLLVNVSYAHAYGVIVARPILKGPLAADEYAKFLRTLRADGAVRCDSDIHSVCRSIIVSIISGKAGRSSYVVGTASYVDFDTDDNSWLKHFIRTAWGHSLQRTSAKSGFTPKQWGIDVPLASPK